MNEKRGRTVTSEMYLRGMPNIVGTVGAFCTDIMVFLFLYFCEEP